jgi:hypothetical protein
MLSVAGLYPDSPGRESQDAHLVSTRFAGDPDLHLFAVFDGHDASGAACAGFAREALPRLLLAAATSNSSPSFSCWQRRRALGEQREGRSGREREEGAGWGTNEMERRGKKEMVGPTFGGGNGGPPEMEGGRGDLEGYAKWRLV